MQKSNRREFLGAAAVGSMAIGRAGAVNAALLAAAILANEDSAVADALDAFRKNQTDKVLADSDTSK